MMDNEKKKKEKRKKKKEKRKKKKEKRKKKKEKRKKKKERIGCRIMVLTDEMKRVISKKMMNGIMMLYLFASARCIISGFKSWVQGRVPVMFVFGVLLFFWTCYPRIRFISDVEKDNITIIRATVIEKYKRPHGKKRAFIILQTETGEQRKMHPLARIYNETNVGDEGIYVKNKHMERYFFMREFNM